MADRSQGREAAIDQLYALPLDEFTAARDELARRLRREGDGDAAAEVKRLRKPSVAAWALNQVRRNAPGQSDELIEAGRRLSEEQERLLAGGGRERFQRAAADERRLVGELVRRAEHELVAADRPVSGAVQEKLRATLHAVASDREAREGLAAGPTRPRPRGERTRAAGRARLVARRGRRPAAEGTAGQGGRRARAQGPQAREPARARPRAPATTRGEERRCRTPSARSAARARREPPPR
jgi:hypothetical protein